MRSRCFIRQWAHGTHQITPTMFDAVAAAYAIDPSQCPTTPMRLEVDAKGFTREVPGEPEYFRLPALRLGQIFRVLYASAAGTEAGWFMRAISQMNRSCKFAESLAHST